MNFKEYLKKFRDWFKKDGDLDEPLTEEPKEEPKTEPIKDLKTFGEKPLEQPKEEPKTEPIEEPTEEQQKYKLELEDLHKKGIDNTILDHEERIKKLEEK